MGLHVKLPMDSIRMGMSIHSYYLGHDSAYLKNVSAIVFNLTLHNTMMRDTPTFRVEYYDFFVNGKKLSFLTYNAFPGGADMFRGLRWIGSFITLGPNQTTTFESEVKLYLEYTKVEEGAIEDIWTPLSNRNFTFQIDGILVSRSSYDPDNAYYPIVWASKPFSASYKYQE